MTKFCWYLCFCLVCVSARYCAYPPEIKELDGFPILMQLSKIQFVNLYVSSCVKTDGPCPQGYSPQCGTYNGKNTYLGSLPNQLDFTTTCDGPRSTHNLPSIDGYKVGISPVRFFLQCQNLCWTYNSTHFWSTLNNCPVFDI